MTAWTGRRGAGLVRAGLLAALVPLGILGPSAALGQPEGAYKPPPTPVLVPADAPAFAPLDAEVDAFVRIPQARAQFNVTGKGLAVVVLDTGANPRHVSFEGQLLPGKNFSTEGDEDDTTDLDGHGSNVAGIIAAKRVSPLERMPTGIAHEAKIIPLKVFPGGQFEKINEALQWVLDHLQAVRQDHGVTISVVNMSLGTSQNLQDINGLSFPVLAQQRELIAKLRSRGVVVTVSAGNSYFDFQPQQGMGFPAICQETVSVGAIYDKNIGPRPNNVPLVTYIDGASVFAARQGRCTVFSQRLGAGADGKNPFRTDIFSPGFIVTSMGPVPPEGSNQDARRTRSTQDGTSQASPVTAGIVLLMQHRYRNLRTSTGDVSAGDDPGLPPVDVIEECLRSGGVAFQDVEDATAQAMDNVTSSGASFIRLDAVGALTALTQRFNQDLQNLQIELFQAKPQEQPAVLERATILQRPVSPQPKP